MREIGRRASLPFVFLNEILNAEDVNFRKIAKIIEFDSGVNLTLRLYYKALFIETQKPISQKNGLPFEVS